MALETLARATKSVPFAGSEVEVHQLQGWEALRLLRLVDKIRGDIGLSEEELKKLNDPGNDLVRWLTGIANKVMDGLVAEIDLEDEKVQLGPLARIVYKEAGRLVGLSAEDFAKGALSEQYGVFNAIVDLEAETGLGKHVRGIIGGLTSFLKSLMMPLIPTGGALPGGTTSSSAPSDGSTTGPMTTSSVSP